MAAVALAIALDCNAVYRSIHDRLTDHDCPSQVAVLPAKRLAQPSNQA